MTRTVGYCILLCFGAVCTVLTISMPDVLSDKNNFLKDFINHEFLNIIGVIVAITLASSAQLHLTLNGIEERIKRRNLFTTTRSGVRQAASALLILFLVGLLLVIVKPLAADEAWSQSLANATALLILLWNVLVLASLSEAVFAIKPILSDDDD